MITLERFHEIEAAVRAAGYDDAIAWSEQAAPPEDPDQFASEAIYVIINGGMSNRVAQPIHERCMRALAAKGSCREAFGHPGKAAGIDQIWEQRHALFAAYLEADDLLAFCETLPWIGAITRYHLAKNFGAPFAKPDVHLNRLAEAEGCSAQELCDRLADDTGYRASTVDLILWRACAIGIIKSRKL